MYRANVIYSDAVDDGMSAAALFGRPLQATQEYITTRFNDYASRIVDTANNMQTNLVDRFNQLRSASYIQRVDSLRHQFNANWQTDTIRYLSSVEQMQEATQVMQRWVMAQPQLRQIYNRGGLSAYDGTYVDKYPGTVGADHYDYRRVMNGVVYQTEEGTSYTQYYEAGVEEVDILSLLDTTAIIRTWKVIDQHIDCSDTDPTSTMNETMG